MTQDLPSRAEKPQGFWGRLAARLMVIGHRRVYKEVAAALDLGVKDRFLDIGCGSGAFIKIFASLPYHVAGLDHSEEMVKLARRNNRKRARAGTAEFRQGDAAELPWKDESFSAVSLIETFYWVKPLETLKEIRRILFPGGRVVIGLGLNADDGQDHSDYAKTFGMKFYSEKEIRSLLEQAKFKDVSFSFSKSFGMPRIMVVQALK